MSITAFPRPVPVRGSGLSGPLASLLLAVLLAGVACLADPVPQVVKDIKAGPAPATGTNSLYQVGDKVFFLATDATHGSELWVTDGTAEGCHLVKDLTTANDGTWSAVRMVGQVDGLLLFNVVGGGLWRSDGTAEGTFMISGVQALQPHMSLGLLWFRAAADPALGIVSGPWRSDGTAEGTYALPTPVDATPALSASLAVMPIYPPWAEIRPGTMTTTIGDSVYFLTDDSRILGFNTTSGVTKDFGVYPLSNDFRGDGTWASALTWNSNTRMEWHAFRGDGGGFTNLAPEQNWMVAVHAGSLGDVHFAAVRAASDHRWSLWRSDGTPAGTRMVKQLPASERSPVPYGFTRAGGKIFFVTDDARTGREPWVTDGSPEGTILLKDIGKGPSGSRPVAFQARGNSVYFGASDGSRFSIWESDGTAKGTVRFQTIPKGLFAGGLSRSDAPVLLDDTVYFSAGPQASVFGPITLWRSDGTDAGTYSLMDNGGGHARPFDDDTGNGIHAVGDSVVFRAWDDENGVLWKSDGTEAGTFPLEAGPKKYRSDYGARNLCNLGEQVLFVNMESSKKKRRTLYGSDGTELSARLIPGIPAKAYPTGITNMVRSGSWIYMHTERHLWATGGDRESTFQLADIATLDEKIVPETMTPLGGALYFSTGSLWRADAGANSVEKVIDAGSLGFYPINLKAAGSLLYFSGWREGSFQLWKSDGTLQGTSRVKSFSATGELKNFTAAGGLLWFTFKPGDGPLQLWCSEGTSGGTRIVTSTLVEFSGPAEGPGGRLFFRAWDQVAGSELWSSDGTAEGTGLVKDIHEGGASSWIAGITRVGNYAYFAATHPVHGRELWKTDGTAEGTVLAADLSGDAGSSSPHHLVLAGSRLFFDASTEATGREVHVLDVSADLAE